MPVKVIRSGATIGTKGGVRKVLMEDVPALNKKVYVAGEFVEEPVDDAWLDGIRSGDPEYTHWAIEVDEPVPVFVDEEVAQAIEDSKAPDDETPSIDDVLAEQEAQRKADLEEAEKEYAVNIEAAEAETAKVAADRDNVAEALEVAHQRIAELEKELEDATAPPTGGDPPAGVNPNAVEKPFDPNDHTVAQVQEYLGTASAEEQTRVLAAEHDGQNRAAFK